MNELVAKRKGHSENHLDEYQAKWFAIYTNYKREKIVAKYLKQARIHHYLPLQSVTRRYVRKIKRVELPLINQYVFIKITKKEYLNVLQCPNVLGFVKFSNNLISIPEAEIELLKRVLGEVENVRVDNRPFEAGDQVEVIGGNLTGLQGTLVKKENSQYLSVQLNNIGLSLNVSIAAHLLRKIRPGIVVK